MDKLAESLQATLQPLIRIMDGKLDLDLGTHKKMSEINEKLAMIARQSPTRNRDRGLFGEAESLPPLKRGKAKKSTTPKAKESPAKKKDDK